MYEFQTLEELLTKYRDYTKTPDDDSILFKTKIKQNLLECPELLYALHNPEYEGELFDEDGNLIEDGEWSVYFNTNIRPYLYFPDSQTDSLNFLCYQVGFSEVPRYNDVEKLCDITFVVLCNDHDVMEAHSGIARHDLIASIIRERFNWSNIFGLQCKLVSDKEGTTDTHYITRTMVFEMTKLNSTVKTTKGSTAITNNVFVRTK